MKTPDPTKAESRAPNSANATSPGRTPKLTERARRAIDALIRSSHVSREAMDRIAGASNSPQVIAGLRRKGVDIECERVEAIDRDGHPCRPGRYFLTDRGRATLAAWGWS